MTQHPWFEFNDLSLSPLRPIIGYGPELFRSAYFLESPPIGEGLLPHEVAHAHNYFIHQVVELGILGLLSSFGIFVALFLVGSRWLLREWQSLSTIHKLVLIGLLATLGGRLLEQMVGFARVSDLTISWVLLAVFVALPASIHNPDPITNPQGPQRRPRASSRRLARPRSGTVPREPHFQWQFSGRMVLVAFLILGIGSMTWFKGINYARAAIIADEGAAQFRIGDQRAALTSLDRAIDLAPDVSSYYENRAALYSSYQPDGSLPQPPGVNAETESDPQGAALVEESHRRNLKWTQTRPNSFRARLALADSTARLVSLTGNSDQVEQSIRLYREAAQMVPNSWPLWNRLAEVYIALGRPEAALEPLETSLEIVGETVSSTRTLLLQGQAYLGMGELDKALGVLNKAIVVAPESAEAHHLRGTIHHALGAPRRAINDFDKATSLDPNSAEYYYSRGTAYQQIGLFQLAVEDLSQAVRLDPFHSNALNNRGLVYTQLGQFDRALEDFSQAIGLDSQLAITYSNRGFVYRLMGLANKAVEDLNQAIQLDPQIGMAYFNRALAYTLLGKDSDAQRDVELAAQLGVNLATLEGAIKELKKARK